LSFFIFGHTRSSIYIIVWGREGEEKMEGKEKVRSEGKEKKIKRDGGEGRV